MRRIKEFIKKLGSLIDLRDVFAFVGIGLIAAGLKDVYAPAALIVPGMILLWLTTRKGS